MCPSFSLNLVSAVVQHKTQWLLHLQIWQPQHSDSPIVPSAPFFTKPFLLLGGNKVHSVQLCLFANRLQYPTRKAIWIRTVCLAAAQRFSLKPAGSRWINRTQRYRLNPCTECHPCNCSAVLLYSHPCPMPLAKEDHHNTVSLESLVFQFL